MSVFDGHEKRLQYFMKVAEGHRAAYYCKALGLTELVTYPKLPRGSVRRGLPTRIWLLDGSSETFRTPQMVADAIVARRQAAQIQRNYSAQTAAKSDVPDSPRCVENAAEPSVFSV